MSRALGLLVLSSDETLETDMRRLLSTASPPVHTGRVINTAQITPESLAAMALTLTAGAASLPEAPDYAVIGYGCTSATAVLGSAKVAELVRAGRATCHVTTPLDGLLAAAAAAGVTRLGLVSPYLPEVTVTLRDVLALHGIATPGLVCFGEPSEAAVARMPMDRIAEAAREVMQKGDVDAVFLSCTNLPTFDIIPGLERELGVPVWSSSLCLGWDMFRLAGQGVADSPGRLLS